MVPRLDLLRQKAAAIRETMMDTATARVPTAHASRYLQQLCKHWSHRFAVEFDAERGTVPFDNGAIALLSAFDDTLEVRVTAPDRDMLARMQRVVADHLDRFAFREAPLAFDWQAVAAA